ncbi:F-box/lrr-repeat protein 12-like [Plakobranchus ocellatus]|uniref:F-box/lrr-repeat protein 12-like n=1 Tax=Plakobranchus ocellatus TaxID=259542 RepID=A0AAV3ZLA7_9GAST|nr:F-box/lrr-repeat protein 12-like [Plakobranchus ocellatus]
MEVAGNPGPFAVKSILEIPENLLLQIFTYLPVKDRCITGRVCKQWRRVVQDNSLWRHVDLLEYRLDLTKMWKVLRAHFSPCLLTMKIRGFAHAVGRKRKKVSISDAMLRELGNRCPNLWLLHLYDCNTDNLSVDSLPTSLHTLAVTHSTWQPRWLKDKQQYLMNLKSLDLSCSVRVDNFDLRDIAQLTNLSRLSINSCYRVKGSDIEIIVKNLPSLVSLDVSKTGIDQEGLHHISRHAQRLNELRVASCSSMCDSSLITLTLGLRELQELDISGCADLTLEGLKSLWSLKKLEKLILKEKPRLPVDDLNCLKKGFSQNIDVVTS